MAPADEARFLALRDRAYAFLVGREAVAEEALLAHVYGGPAPAGLRARLAEPLLGDARIARRGDGFWTIAGRAAITTDAFTALALTTTGPTPGRARVVRVSARLVQNGETLERFDVTLNPGKRVPRYVATRLGLEPAMLEDLPPFADVLDDVLRFFGSRPIFAQDARLTWAFVEAEARRAGRSLVQPLLIDANDAASRVLDLHGKPNVALVAARLGIGAVQPDRADEEARLLATVGSQLVSIAGARAVLEVDSPPASTTLRRGATARALPDEPGVYVLRDAQHTPLYVGKARRLRSRMAAYVHRPLGPTRRLEGLVAVVDAVDTTECATDLEALVLEDRQIRGLAPRFNTARRQRTPRLWIRLPPISTTRRRRAPRRLEPSLGPSAAQGEFVGPFRNENTAEQARLLARRVFDLDQLRRTNPGEYEHRLRRAWAFLHGDSQDAERQARGRSTCLLRQVLAFDVGAMLLPADPRQARYAVVRPGPRGIEGFLLDRGVLRNWRLLDADDTTGSAAALLHDAEPRTAPEDADVVLRWFGAQRPPAQLICLPDDAQAAADAIESAALALAGEA